VAPVTPAYEHRIGEPRELQEFAKNKEKSKSLDAGVGVSVKPKVPDVAIVNSYQLEKFSLVTHPEQPSEESPGPVLKPVKEYPLLQIPVAFIQSALLVELGPPAIDTHDKFACHPVLLTVPSDQNLKVKHPLGWVEVNVIPCKEVPQPEAITVPF
jgi:hypothetical protein